MENVLQGLGAALEIEQVPGRDLFIIARYMIPTDAYLAQGCLVAAGIPAVVADANHAQADMLIVPAMGGVRVLVPGEYVDQSMAVMAARERGEFTLGDDFDVGEEA